MGADSIKGPLLPVANLPCGECRTKPCCRRGNHGSEFATVLDGKPVAYNERGDCPFLIDEQCSIQDRKPWGCRVFSCANQPFRRQHPEVDILLQSKGR